MGTSAVLEQDTGIVMKRHRLLLVLAVILAKTGTLARWQ